MKEDGVQRPKVLTQGNSRLKRIVAERAHYISIAEGPEAGRILRHIQGAELALALARRPTACRAAPAVKKATCATASGIDTPFVAITNPKTAIAPACAMNSKPVIRPEIGF